MKYLFLLIIIFSLSSCNTKNEEASNVEKDSIVIDSLHNRTVPDTIETKDSVVSRVPKKVEVPKAIREYPADGIYRYDMAFAEFQNKSMGEKVTVIINGDSIKIVYEGDGKLTAAKGAILDEGIIVKHKSGVWIIAHHIKDAELDVFGGCSGGPAVIDFPRKKYITC
ncbi:MAG: hypothetical protein ABIW38_02875 [Ferruginibacter sp.]